MTHTNRTKKKKLKKNKFCLNPDLKENNSQV